MRAWKISPIGPRWMIKAKQKTQHSGSRQARPARAHHGQTVVAATAGLWWQPWPLWSNFPQLLWFPSRPFVFPGNFSICAAILLFKGGCIWLYSGSTFHSPITFLMHFLVLIQIREKEGEAKIANNPCRVCDRRFEKLQRDFGGASLFLLFSFLTLDSCFVILI